MLRILLFVCCISISGTGALKAERSLAADSVLQTINRQPPDSNQVKALISYGCQLFPYQLDKSAAVFMRALRISRQLNYHKGVADFACYYMYIQDMRGEYRQSLFMLQQAVLIYTSLKDTLNQSRALSYCGMEYQQMANFPAAASAYLEALKLAEAVKDSIGAGMILHYLSAVFISLGDVKKGTTYAAQAYEYGRQLQHTSLMATALLNLGECKSQQGNPSAASRYFKRALELGREKGDSLLVLNALTATGRAYADLSQSEQSLRTYEKALLISVDDPGPENRMQLYMGYAKALYQDGKYAAADIYLRKTIALARLYFSGDFLRRAYLAASDNQAAQHQYRQAFQLRKAYEQLNDSLVGDATRSNVQQLEMQYQSEKKDRDLAEKKLELIQKDLLLQRKNKWIGFFLTGVVMLLIASFLVWQKLIHRHHLQEQQLQTMEIEKTLQVLEAMMQGEEKERTRLSKDLHDGVGGLLSAVKMHFCALKYELTFLQQDKGFHHALGMLDDAIGEVRKTAHNLMPDILSRMGLAGALELFCRNVSHSRKLNISFYTSGDIQRFRGNFELTVYRIVQELINNIIKHAHATTALVQLTGHEQLLTITVEDNGVGFENSAHNTAGMGLKNLRARIKSLNGHLTLTATPGCGTTAYIEFNIAIMQLTEMEAVF
ncbi:tetratricopeptide repeat-containing sensor histidine kinase [Chitinophaga arvensicola]|uniref:Tetratricopeptide repeat-containing protein n=1 Tax=Chitinophaga arvensicola TaxID=29529 RepID=A0A1I0QF34_9BACT|nr:tetratricopeptide repeat protein [Chitinophaga arvensicola]SEW25714.1 Tetratricopeptide repeat-containing protein [Chitinophaga arvensicola]